MAKVRSIIGMSGSVGGMVFVDSKAYGKYSRAKRGTYKDAPVNDAFKKSGSELKRALPYAKMIKDAIDEHRGISRDGRFWSRLVSEIKKSIAKDEAVDFHKLKGLRIAVHPLARTFILQYLTTRFDKELYIGLTFPNPQFKSVGRVMVYCVSVIAVFIHTPEQRATAKFISKDYPMTEDYSSTSLDASFIPPGFADTAIVIVKCQAMRDGELIANVDAVGMDVVEVVRLGE